MARPAGGLRSGPGGWVAACGRDGGGAMRVRGPWRLRGGAGGPAGGRRCPRVPHTVGSVGVPGARATRGSGCKGRTCRASACPMRASLRPVGPAASRWCGPGDEVGAGRVGSGGWPRRRWCPRARVPEAGVGRLVRVGLWPVASLRVPH